MIFEKFGNDVLIEKTVISVPTSFNYIQKKEIKNCAEISGFKNVELIDDTIASIVEYKRNNENEL